MGSRILALGLFLEDDLGQDRAGDVIAGARVLDLELGAVLHHGRQMIERHIAGGLGIVETPVRVFLDDDRAVGLGFLFRHVDSPMLYTRLRQRACLR